MQAMDQINRRYGRGSLVLGCAGHWGTAGLGDEAGEAVVGVYDGLGLGGVSGGGEIERMG
jgi:hypothetical protein